MKSNLKTQFKLEQQGELEFELGSAQLDSNRDDTLVEIIGV